MKMTVGYGRRRTKPRRSAREEILFAVGLLALGAALAGPVARGSEREERVGPGEAMAVMRVSSDAVSDAGEREILAEPERYAVPEEDRSVFDEIGTFFANLIRGE